MNSAEILSSTGDLGLQLRQPERMYWNSRLGVVQDARFIERQACRAQETLDRGIATRIVGRLLMTYEAFQDSYLNSPLVREGLEAMIRFEDDEDLLIMAMYGFNSPHRHPITPTEHMVRDTSELVLSESPRNRINRLRAEGLTFIDRIEPQSFDSILELWGSTFGWDLNQVRNLQNRLAIQEQNDPSTHSVWFSAAVYNHKIISLATAERLSLPILPKFNQYIDVIENTEWRTRPGWESRGIMGATAAHLNAQIVRARRGLLDNTRIIAETNYLSHAYRVGAASGMQVPPRRISGDIFVPQILRQNVEVGDGLYPDGLRDFVFMELPPPVIEKEYSDAALQDMLGRSI